MKKLFTLFLLVASYSAFGINITFEVSMKGSGMDLSNGVYWVGGVYNGSWGFTAMTAGDDSLYTVTMDLNTADTIAYYFITTGTWDNYADYREPTIPETCDADTLLGWSGDRGFIVPDQVTTFSYIWGSCDAPSSGGGTSSIKTIDATEFAVFPNPASEDVTVSFGKLSVNATIDLFNVTGKVIQNYIIEPNTKEFSFNVAELPAGIYVIRFKDGSVNEYKKLVVQ